MVLILTVIISILVLFFSWLFYPKVPGAYSGYGVRSAKTAKAKVIKENLSAEQDKVLNKESKQYINVTGQMSLQDLERVSGIPARKIADKLGLPIHDSLNQRLGRLRKQHLFTMQEVRDVVASLMKENERR